MRMTRDQIRRGLDTETLTYEGKGGRMLSVSSAPLRAPLSALDGLFSGRHQRVRNIVSPHSAPENAQRTATRRLQRVFDGIAEDVGLPSADLYPHRFRHTYATLFLQELEGDPEALLKLQDQMQWANLATAQNYLRRNRRPELDLVESRLHERLR